MPEPPDKSPTPPDDRLEDAIAARLNSLDAEGSRRTTRYALKRFAQYLRHHRNVHAPDDITPTDCRRWAQSLRDEAENDHYELGAPGGRQYFSLVRATCTWWVRDGRMDRNPAKTIKAEEPLPEVTEEPARQSWTPEQRERLLKKADRAVDEALDKKANDEATEQDVLLASRDRTLAYLLAWSGVRGAEVLRKPNDDKRNGAVFEDIYDDGVLQVFGKSREQEAAPLREPVQTRLDMWKQVLDPPSDHWPIFPVLNKATLSKGLDVDSNGALPSSASVRARLEEYQRQGLAPPAISTTSGRNVMKRLSEAADIDVEEGYLQPHGGRRALGDTVYEQNPVAAQDVLRHKSIETTNEAYRKQRQGQRADELDEMLDDR